MEQQDGLSPFIRERLARISKSTVEEDEKIRELEALDALLKDFYMDEIDAQQLFDALVDDEKSGKQHLLQEAQQKLKKSFKWTGLPIVFQELSTGHLSVSYDEKKSEETAEELVVELNANNFNDMVKNSSLLVVDCWAAWCAPCRMVAPVIDKLAVDYKGRIVFGKLNVDFNQQIAVQFGVMSIPTLLIFKNGSLVGQKVGALPKEVLESELQQYL